MSEMITEEVLKEWEAEAAETVKLNPPIDFGQDEISPIVAVHGGRIIELIQALRKSKEREKILREALKKIYDHCYDDAHFIHVENLAEEALDKVDEELNS